MIHLNAGFDWINAHHIFVFLDKDLKVIKYKGEPGKLSGILEVRGIVNKDHSLSFGEFTQYDSEFDLATYEHMLEYYHGMCKDLCIKQNWKRKAGRHDYLCILLNLIHIPHKCCF